MESAMGKATRASRSQSKVTGFYVASTHWDREWYEPFQHYRFRLVDVIDGVLGLLERDPEYHAYQLDGQTCVLEDYLEIRPEARGRLQAMCAAGRLQVGPWYVMPDEFLPAGESLVRNLLRGHAVAAEFGGAMKEGFACDIFGHNSQLPQIFRGFGIETAVIWRGTNFPKHAGLFCWQAADGTEVLAYTFPDRGYGEYQFEVRDAAQTNTRTLDVEKAVAGVKRMFEAERARVPGDAILLFDGIDHVPVEPRTSELLALARRRGMKTVHGTLRMFFDAVRQQGLKLETFKGELRDPGQRPGAGVIPGVVSSRVYLKQKNAQCEMLLTQWAEPFCTAATLVGEAYPAAYLEVAWKHLLLNHPHDSICGCSIDQVHQDMMYRFDQCRLIAQRACQMSLRAIADRTALPKLQGDEDFAVTVFNPSAVVVEGVVDLPLHFRMNTENRFSEWFGYEPIVGFRLFDTDGNEVPYQRLEVTKVVPVRGYDRLAGYRGDKCEQVRVALRLSIPPCGWTTLVCRPTKERVRSAGTQVVDDHTMENEHLRVSIQPNGTLDVHERASGQTYAGLMAFEERADIGDGWYHGNVVNDEIHTGVGAAADIALLQDGFAQTTFRVRVVMNVPERFLLDEKVMRRSSRLVPMAITSWVTLRAGARHVEVRTEVENTAREHRLRVLLPTGIAADTYYADSPFDVVERPVALHADSHTWHEQEVETKPQYSFTAMNDGKRGLAVVSCGQPESTVCDRPQRPIAMTLFRGFPRTVGAEGELGGQMLGTTSHRYWIVPHGGALPRAELCRLGQRLAAGLECVSTEKARSKLLRKKPLLGATASWLEPGPGPLVITACKRSEDGAAVVLRMFNPTDEEAQQRLKFLVDVQSAQRANMLEEPVEALRVRGAAVTVAARPKEIVTLRVQLAALA